RRIEEAATRRQAAIDRGEAVIVGVNRYRPESETPVEARAIDNQAVRAAQVERLAEIRRQRDALRVAASLDHLAEVARSGHGNLLAAAVEAARARATVGEISDALRRVFGDHAAMPEIVSDIYGRAYAGDPEFAVLMSRLDEVAAELGGKPRLFVAKLGQDGHDRGAHLVASAFGDIGFEVISGPLFQTPEEAAERAIVAKADVVGVSSL